MTRFEKLITAIKSYDNTHGDLKATAHHSAVSVRVAEMEAAMGNSVNADPTKKNLSVTSTEPVKSKQNDGR